MAEQLSMCCNFGPNEIKKVSGKWKQLRDSCTRPDYLDGPFTYLAPAEAQARPILGDVLYCYMIHAQIIFWNLALEGMLDEYIPWHWHNMTEAHVKRISLHLNINLPTRNRYNAVERKQALWSLFCKHVQKNMTKIPDFKLDEKARCEKLYPKAGFTRVNDGFHFQEETPDIYSLQNRFDRCADYMLDNCFWSKIRICIFLNVAARMLPHKRFINIRSRCAPCHILSFSLKIQIHAVYRFQGWNTPKSFQSGTDVALLLLCMKPEQLITLKMATDAKINDHITGFAISNFKKLISQV